MREKRPKETATTATDNERIDPTLVDPMLEKEIRDRAYELYEERMRCTAADDWLRAEREVRAKLKAPARAAVT